MNFTIFIAPLVICSVLVVALIKKVDILKEFTQGVWDGLKTVTNLIAPLTLFLTSIGMLRASGALDVIVEMVEKPFSLVGIPKEILPLALLKPFSGSGSFAIIKDIFSQYGVDSYIGRVASVIAGSTETTFYTISVYFGAVGISKTRHTVPSALTADIIGFILSAFFVRFLFY